jgi:invasion protein IalB
VAANAVPAPATTAPAPDAKAAATPPAGASPLWAKTCDVNPQTKQQVCNTSQEIWLNTDGSVRASFAVQTRPDKKYTLAGFVPLSFIIPAGVQVSVDGDKKAALQFMQCNPPIQGTPPGCFVVGEGAEDLIAAMRKGAKIALVVTDRQNQQLPIEMSLAGFGPAFDGAGMDPQAAAKAAIQKSKEFQDAAKAAAQRMIDKQRQETGGAAPASQN